ncbi:MAG TPA: ankyrin repeat domain-containing protein [Armatimonadota bacterium]|nr:ankyrin repeat domain-containing protein [Armatimonadota bacterium]
MTDRDGVTHARSTARAAAVVLLGVCFACLLGCRGDEETQETKGPENRSFVKAAGGGDIATVQQMLADGADPNAKDQYTKTALHDAANFGKTDVVKLLLDHGADVNAKDGSDDTPLHCAMLSTGSGADVVKLLLDNGADINATNEHGRTPLHKAVTSIGGQFETLLSYGPDATIRDDKGETALQRAVDAQATQSAARLREYGATE